jgi:Zn-dependent metalloprotease
MKFFKIAMIMLLATVSARAFDQTDRLSGTIDRPGMQSLPLSQNNPPIEGSTSAVTVQYSIIGTPKLMTMQYQSAVKPSETTAFANDFIANYSTILKNDFSNFRVTASNLILDKFYYINLQQIYQGVDIWGSHFNIKITKSGKAFMAGGEVFSEIKLDINPTIDAGRGLEIAKTGIDFSNSIDDVRFNQLVILPLIFADQVEYHLCYVYELKIKESGVNWRAFVDAHAGQLLWRENTNRYERIVGDIATEIQLATPYDTYTTMPLANSYVYLENSNAATSNSQGVFQINTSMPGPLNIDLYPRGSYFRVVNAAGGVGLISELAMPGDSLSLTWNDDNSTIVERDAFYHGQVVHDFIKMIDPGLTAMDFQMQININVVGSCNAYYQQWDRSINFYRAGGNCPNIAQIADVVYHEWGHGLTNLQYQAGGSGDPNGAMHEGFSDYLGCTITNQSLVGRGFTGPGSYLRNVRNTNRYPDDWTGESHNDGLIISGALWDLRLALADRPRYVDTLWQYSKYGYGTDFTAFFYDMLATDDDDGNIQNGTPHANQIYYCFGNLHGIGPGVQVTVSHNPIVDSEDSLSAYTANAAVQSLNSMTNGSVTLRYSTGGDFHAVEMINLSGNLWSGEIPNQPFGTNIRYYIEAIDNFGLRGTNPPGAPDSLNQFYVGYDTIAPVIAVNRVPVNTIDLFGPYGPFVIGASDVHGIDSTSMEFHYQINYGTVMSLPMSNLGSNSFVLNSLALGQQLNTGDTIHYWFTGRDLAYNHNLGRYPIIGALGLAMADRELIDNFDTDISKWQVVGSGWTWFDRQGYQSNQCLRGNDGDTYSNNMNTLVYRDKSYNLTPYDHVWLSFKTKHILMSGDSCYAVVSNSASGPWTKIGAFGGASQWTAKAYEMSGFAGPGNDQVYFGFQFISDSAVTQFGVMIDNVMLGLTQSTDIGYTQALPSEMELHQNYPNPFNMKTTIKFDIVSEQKVTVVIYDILGRKVADLIDSWLKPGTYQINWDGHTKNGLEAASGIYYYRLQVGEKAQIKSMTLIK